MSGGGATTAQVRFEDVEPGTALPPLTTRPITLKDLVRWAGATDDYNEIHYDHDVARGKGLPAAIVHGPLKSALIARMLMSWIGPEGSLRKLSCQYRGMDVPGDALACQGRVTNKYVDEGEHVVECQVWAQNSKGAITTQGIAVVVLPCGPST